MYIYIYIYIYIYTYRYLRHVWPLQTHDLRAISALRPLRSMLYVGACRCPSRRHEHGVDASDRGDPHCSSMLCARNRLHLTSARMNRLHTRRSSACASNRKKGMALVLFEQQYVYIYIYIYICINMQQRSGRRPAIV